MSPLHLAAEIGHIGILDYLVKQGADINTQDDEGVKILCHHTYTLVLLVYLIEFELASSPGKYCIHFSVFLRINPFSQSVDSHACCS